MIDANETYLFVMQPAPAPAAFFWRPSAAYAAAVHLPVAPPPPAPRAAVKKEEPVVYRDEPPPPMPTAVGDEEEEDAPTTALSIAMAVHGVALVAALVLVAVLYANAAADAPLTTPAYMLAPADAACLAWLDGDCVSERDAMRWTALEGVVALSEHRARGLLSEVHPAGACLATQAMAVALLPQGAYARRVGAAILVATGGLLLFMQSAWRIGFGALLWLELLLLAAFFALGRRMRAEAIAGLCMPALVVAALSAAGEDDASALALVYCALTASVLLWVAHERAPTPQAMAAAWLCLGPLALRAGLRFDAIAKLPVAPPAWILASVAFALAWPAVGACARTTNLGGVELRLVMDQGALAALGLLVLAGLVSTYAAAP